jgi:hypothetical protein
MCPSCESNRIIPIVDGSLDSARATLAVQHLIALGGSFATSDGSPIWACADCGGWITDPEFLMQEGNSAVVKEYDSVVQAAFAAYTPISRFEFRMLTGRNLIKSFVRQQFNSGTREIRVRLESDEFVVTVVEDVTSQRHIRNELFTADRFEQMCSFVHDSDDSQQLVVRVGVRDMLFRVASTSSEEIVIRPG